MTPADRDRLTAHVLQLRASIEGIRKAKSKALDDHSLHAIPSWRLLEVGFDLLCMWVRQVEAEIRFDIACDELTDAEKVARADAPAELHRRATATAPDRVIQAEAERREPLMRPQVAPYAEEFRPE